MHTVSVVRILRRAILWGVITGLLAVGTSSQAAPLAATTTGAWSWPAGMAANGNVYDLLWNGGNLYAGGSVFSPGGDADCNKVGIWTGSAWDCPSGMALNNLVWDLDWDGSNLWAGGLFIDAGGDGDCDKVARWTGSAWDCPSGMALNGNVFAVAWDGSNLWAGGVFTDAGGDGDCDKIARWTGAAWDCPSGMALASNNEPYTLLWDGSNLWAGGFITSAGGDADCEGIARWSGSAWSCPSGIALPGYAFALLWDGAEMWAGGSFVNAGGDADCDNIARWTGSAWSCPNGMALGDSVWALAADGDNLYASGEFDNAGGDGDCDRIAVWTGSAWDCPSGMSLNADVYGLAFDSVSLQAGGFFTDAGGDTDADYLAMWRFSLFEDAFESGDFTAWSNVNNGNGNLTVGAPCAMEGTYGMCAVSTNNKRKQVIDSVPDDEARYYASFLFDHNNVTISGASNRIRIFQGRMDTSFPFIVLLRYSGGNRQISLRMQTDAGPGNFIDSAWYTITDATHTIGVDWQASSGPGNNDGWGDIYVDGTLQGGGHTVSGVDNDTLVIRGTRLGITSRMDGVTMTGTLYFDDFFSDADGYPE